MILFKKYIGTDKPNIFIKFTISFNKDTYHWATSSSKEKGYQLVATPIEKSGRCEVSGAFTGFYKIIYPIGRQSKKRLYAAVDTFYKDIEVYLEFFRKKGFNIEKYEENTNGQKTLF